MGLSGLLLVAVLAADPPCAGQSAPRDSSARKAFTEANPCPGGRDRGSTRRCRGYVVDHICPLMCCGLDKPQNMQWQTKAQAKAKDRWEGSCVTCAPGGPTGQDGVAPEGAGGDEPGEPESDEGQPTARCRDGSFSYATEHTGACSRHGGVAEWLDK